MLARFFVAFLIFFSASTASAQAVSPTAPLRPEERPIVTEAVQDVYDAYQSRRRANGVGNLLSGALVSGLGTYFYISGTDQADAQNGLTFRIIGIGLMLSAVPQIMSGVWNIFYSTPQEDIAAKLLNDEGLMDRAGVLFVEQEARRAKRNRLVGGSTSIAQGLAILGSYYLYAQVFGSYDLLLIFFGIAAAIQTIGGVVELVGLSGPERSYQNMLMNLGRSPEETREVDNRVSKVRVTPTLLSNEGKFAAGAGFSFTF